MRLAISCGFCGTRRHAAIFRLHASLAFTRAQAMDSFYAPLDKDRPMGSADFLALSKARVEQDQTDPGRDDLWQPANVLADEAMFAYGNRQLPRALRLAFAAQQHNCTRGFTYELIAAADAENPGSEGSAFKELGPKYLLTPPHSEDSIMKLMMAISMELNARNSFETLMEKIDKDVKQVLGLDGDEDNPNFDRDCLKMRGAPQTRKELKAARKQMLSAAPTLALQQATAGETRTRQNARMQSHVQDRRKGRQLTPAQEEAAWNQQCEALGPPTRSEYDELKFVGAHAEDTAPPRDAAVSRAVWLRTRLGVLKLIDSECAKAVEASTKLCQRYNDMGMDGARSQFGERWAKLFARGSRKINQSLARAALTAEEACLVAFPPAGERKPPGYYWPSITSIDAPELTLQLLAEDEGAVIRVLDREVPENVGRSTAEERMDDHRRYVHVMKTFSKRGQSMVLGDPSAQNEEEMRICGGCSTRLQTSKTAAIRQHAIAVFCLALVELVCQEEGCRKCPVCGGAAHSACGSCHYEWYCTSKCQKQHWPVHKGECRTLAKMSEIAPLGEERLTLEHFRDVAFDLTCTSASQVAKLAGPATDRLAQTHPNLVIQIRDGVSAAMSQGATVREALIQGALSSADVARRPWCEVGPGMRTRAMIRQQLERSRDLYDKGASARDAMQAEAQVLAAIGLLRGLAREEQSMGLLGEAALQLAETMGARPQTAARAVEKLQSLMAQPGWVANSELAAQVRSQIERVRACVPSGERQCVACGELKAKEHFSQNQWRQGNRRCKACQEARVATTVTQREDRAAAELEAADFARIHLAMIEAEEKRVCEELARRNANEHTDAECQICFDECPDRDKCVLHGTMHWLCKPCVSELLSCAASEGTLCCPTCRQELDETHLRGLVS